MIEPRRRQVVLVGRAILALLVAGMGACDVTPPSPTDAGVMDAPDANACTGGPIEIFLGTASSNALSSYRPLAAGDPVSLVPGPQGGQHIWVAMRGRGFDPTLPRFDFRAYRPSDDALIGRIRIRLPMVTAPEDPTLFALPSQTLTLDDQAYCTVLGGDVRIEIDFNDLAGHCGAVRRTVHLVDIDPATPESIRMAWRRCCDDHLARCYPSPLDASTRADIIDASID